jgi:hypothetical protein
VSEFDPIEQALEQTLARISPSDLDRRRVRGAIGLPPNLPLLAPERVPLVALRTHPVRKMLIKGAGLAALLGAGFATGYWMRGSSSAEVPPTAPTGVEALAVTPSEPMTAGLAEPAVMNTSLTPDLSRDAPESVQPATAPASQRPPRSEAVKVPTDPDRVLAKRVNDELALLRRCERALRAQNADLALALLRELDERYRDTRFAEERRAARVLAHCLGRDDAASELAQAFLRERPSSVYSKRIVETCRLTEKP